MWKALECERLRGGWEGWKSMVEGAMVADGGGEGKLAGDSSGGGFQDRWKLKRENFKIEGPKMRERREGRRKDNKVFYSYEIITQKSLGTSV